jgi:rhodanese-related sulfurtransferase
MSEVRVEVDVTEAKQLLDDKQIVLIDCREQSEWEHARIEGAVLLPMSNWNEVASQLDQFSGQQLVVHCHHGGRSMRVVQWLRQNGFSDALNLRGGIDAWSLEIDSSIPRY